MSVVRHFDEPSLLRDGMACLFCCKDITEVPFVAWFGAADIFICNACCKTRAIDSLNRDVLEANHPEWWRNRKLPADEITAQFINDCIRMHPGHATSSKEISAAFAGWGKKNMSEYGASAHGTNLFSHLKEMGFSTWLAHGFGPRWGGLTLTDTGRQYATEHDPTMATMEGRNSPDPHWRRAHERHLASGKVVPVRQARVGERY